MKHLKFAAVLLCATVMAPTASFASDISVSTGVDYVSEYVFRGLAFGGASVQPYAEASIGDFTVGGWFSTQIGEESALASDEFDLYVGYSVPLDSSISLDLGATYYHFPQGGTFFSTDGGNTGSYEVSASVGLGEVPLAPAVTAYYDFTFESFTLEGSVGHSFAIGESQSFDLGLTAGGNYSVNTSDNTLDFEEIITVDADGVVTDISGGGTSDSRAWFGVGVSAGF